MMIQSSTCIQRFFLSKASQEKMPVRDYCPTMVVHCRRMCRSDRHVTIGSPWRLWLQSFEKAWPLGCSRRKVARPARAEATQRRWAWGAFHVPWGVLCFSGTHLHSRAVGKSMEEWHWVQLLILIQLCSDGAAWQVGLHPSSACSVRPKDVLVYSCQCKSMQIGSDTAPKDPVEYTFISCAVQTSLRVYLRNYKLMKQWKM